MTDELKNVLNDKKFQSKLNLSKNIETDSTLALIKNDTYKFVLEIVKNTGECWCQNNNRDYSHISEEYDLIMILKGIFKRSNISRRVEKDLLNYINIYAIKKDASFFRYNYILIDINELKKVLESLGYYVQMPSTTKINLEITPSSFEDLIKRVSVNHNDEIKLIDKYNDELIELLKSFPNKRNEYLKVEREKLFNNIEHFTKELISIIYEEIGNKYLKENSDLLSYSVNYSIATKYDYLLKDMNEKNEYQLLVSQYTGDLIDVNLLNQYLQEDGFNIMIKDKNSDSIYTEVSISKNAFEEKIREVNREEKALKRIFRR